MAQVTIITIGSLKESFWTDAVAEYKKRLGLYAKVEEINLKEEKISNEDSLSDINSALNAEGDKILSKIPDGAWVVALCVEGKQVDSIRLASLIGEGVDKTGKVCFIIGSSHGLADKVKNRADFKLSVSQLTFPHQLIRVSLYEMLYRSFTIRAGKKYHK